MAATAAWLAPPSRTELIENLVSGVGADYKFFTINLALICNLRPLQPIKCRYSRGLPLPPDSQRGV